MNVHVRMYGFVPNPVGVDFIWFYMNLVHGSTSTYAFYNFKINLYKYFYINFLYHHVLLCLRNTLLYHKVVQLLTQFMREFLVMNASNLLFVTRVFSFFFVTRSNFLFTYSIYLFSFVLPRYSWANMPPISIISMKPKRRMVWLVSMIKCVLIVLDQRCSLFWIICFGCFCLLVHEYHCKR